MNGDLLNLIDEICRQKELDRELLIGSVEKALLQAARKRYGSHKQIRVSIDRNTGEVKVFMPKQVVEIMTDFISQIPIEEAQAIDPNVKIGEMIEVESAPKDFGRIAAQTARQIIAQKIREAERQNIYEEYKSREGQVVSGIVQRFEQGDVIVDLDRAEAILPHSEQIKHENYRRGTSFKFLILEVRKDSRNPQIVLSRTHSDLLRRLFEIEVPEIADGLVEIKAIAREPGERSKVAVVSNSSNLDAVRTCVGMRGSRVQMIVNELGGEKIDILEWNPVPEKFIASALSPAKIISVIVNQGNKSAKVIVPDDQLSLAIGKRGQNVRLAAKLTGWNIDIKSQSEVDLDSSKAMGQTISRSIPLTELEGITNRVVELLQQFGFSSIQDLAKAEVERLVSIPGLGDRLAKKLISMAKDKLQQLEKNTEQIDALMD